MSIAVAAILDGAYTRSAKNDPGKLAGDAELVAHLDRCYQRVWALMARARPEQFAASVSLRLLGIPPSATLPANLIDLLHVVDAAGVAVAVAPIHELARGWHLAPCVAQQGRTLRSRATLPGDPRTGATLTATILDAPAALVSSGALLDARWPTRHAQLLVDYLAVYLSVKDAGRAPADHAKLVADANTNAGALAAEFGLPPAAVEWLHAPVERAAA